MTNFLDLIKKTHSGGHHGKGLHIFINPFSYLIMRKKGLFGRVDYIYLDGFLLVKILNAMGIKVNRKSFDMTSLAPLVFQWCIDYQKKVYFIGSTLTAIKGFLDLIESNFPNLQIVGHRNGYFNNNLEREQELKKIAKISPDVLIVGMGTPHQEIFLIDLAKAGWTGVGYTCGGFIHQTVKGINYYPKFFDKYNLRWLFRIYDEPKLITRYCIYYPISICLFIFDIIRFRLRRNGD